VPLAVKIPGSELELARKGGNESTILDFIGQVRDAHGRIAGTVRDSIEVKLKGGTWGNWASASWNTAAASPDPGRLHAQVPVP